MEPGPGRSGFRDMLRTFTSESLLDRVLEDGSHLMHVEEYLDGDTCVIRAELPGVDPDKDVEISVADGVLHLRREGRANRGEAPRGILQRVPLWQLRSQDPAPRRRDGGGRERDLQGRNPGGPGTRAQGCSGFSPREDPDQPRLTIETVTRRDRAEMPGREGERPAGEVTRPLTQSAASRSGRWVGPPPAWVRDSKGDPSPASSRLAPSTSSWSASSAFPSRRSRPWAPSARAASMC